MNKIKIILVIASVLAVVGGILAFKASKFGSKFCIGVPYVVGIEASDCEIETFSSTVDPTIIIYAKPGSCLAGGTCPSLGLSNE